MEDSQEVGHGSVSGCVTMKWSWCDGLAFSDFVGHLIDDGSWWAGHWMDRRVCTEEM